MRSWLSLLIPLLLCARFQAQPILHRQTIDEDQNVFSYADDLGTVRIVADTFIAVPPPTFQHVAAFITTQSAVYRFHNGKEVAGIHFFDNWYDCENHGTIRFRDSTGNVGILSSEGTVLIQALYNEILPLVNGYTVGLKGAEKTCFELDCEHFYWKGGQEILINQEGLELGALDSTVSYWDLDLNAIQFTDLETTLEGVHFKDQMGAFFIPYSHALLNKRYMQGFDTLKAHLAPSLVVKGKSDQTLTRNQFWKRYGKELKRFYEQGAPLADYYLTASYNLSTNPQWSLWLNNCGDLTPEYKVFNIYSPIRSKKIAYLTVIQKGEEFWLLEIALH